jgi:Zn ribbon nucleic-acid-binding protein
MAAPDRQNEKQTPHAGVLCPRCQAEMHPLFLYEDREPDTWLCFGCGHLEWTSPGRGTAVPSVDQ